MTYSFHNVLTRRDSKITNSKGILKEYESVDFHKKFVCVCIYCGKICIT